MRALSRIFAAVAVLVLLLAGSQSAFANSVSFDFTFSGSGISGSGVLTATTVSGNEFLVTSISGMQNGSSMTLLAPGTFAQNNNDMFSSSPFLTLGGLAFTSNGAMYNVYFNPATSSYFECSSVPCLNGMGTAITFSITPGTAVPEPGTLTLLGSGLLGLAGVARRKLG